MDKKITEYFTWIDKNYPTFDVAMGKCMEATDLMIKVFPELRKARGRVYLEGITEEIHHAWCVDLSGRIIDPTAIQYQGRLILYYDEYPPNHIALNYPRYKCMNCGEYAYDTPDNNNKPFCSTRCIDDYEKTVGW